MYALKEKRKTRCIRWQA